MVALSNLITGNVISGIIYLVYPNRHIVLEQHHVSVYRTPHSSQGPVHHCPSGWLRSQDLKESMNTVKFIYLKVI